MKVLQKKPADKESKKATGSVVVDDRDLDEMLKFIESGEMKSKPAAQNVDTTAEAKTKKEKHQIKKKTPKDIVRYKK